MVGFLLAGLVVATLAWLVTPGRHHVSFVTNLLLGMWGALVGGRITVLLGLGRMIRPDLPGFAVAVVAALVLIGTAEAIEARDE